MAEPRSPMPSLLGLCPTSHGFEFYMPLGPGESTVCPVPGCGEQMVVYVTQEALAAAVVGGVDVAAKVRDANQAERRRLEGALRDVVGLIETASSRARILRARDVAKAALPEEGGR